MCFLSKFKNSKNKNFNLLIIKENNGVEHV